MQYYKLNKDYTVTPTNNKCFRGNNMLAYTELTYYRVSTIFLYMDHSWESDVPILFETMVFPPYSYVEVACQRYATYADAMAGHTEICKEWADIIELKDQHESK